MSLKNRPIRARIMLSLIFCLFISSARGQTEQGKKISGKIINEKKEPVAYATVTLLRTDSSIVNGGLTDDNGSFEIVQADTGKFLLRVSGIGFTTQIVTDIQIAENGMGGIPAHIIVRSASTELKEVEVSSERSMMELALDKKVFNVEKNITTAGGSAADVLQNVPSVSVEVDGSISLRGKNNVTVLIDGKPAALLGGDIASALKSLPAASIEKVEIITNPSAKYDAQGVGGIINIVTKKDLRLGVNGSVTVGGGTRDKYNGGLSLNRKNEKWNIFMNSNIYTNHNYSFVTNDRTDKDGANYHTFEDNMPWYISWFQTTGAEYNISEKSTIGIIQNLSYVQWRERGNTTYEVSGTDGNLSSIQKRSFDQTGAPFSSSTSVEHMYKSSKPNQHLVSNFTYAQTWELTGQTYVTNNFDSNNVSLPVTIVQRASGKAVNKNVNLQADLATPFISKQGMLEVGWRSQIFRSNSSNDPTVDTGNGRHVDSILMVSYNYNQQVHAAYARFGDQVNNWSYNIGLRLEYAMYQGTTQFLKGNKFTTDYLSLFPSAYVSYKLPKDQTFNLSYTRRTNRPGFHNLIPFVNVSNPQNTSIGNPQLVPEFIHHTELSYNKQVTGGHNVMGSLYYQYTNNLMDYYRTFNADGTRSTQLRNINNGVTYGLELTATVRLLSGWTATTNANFFMNRIVATDIDPTINDNGSGWFAKCNSDLRLPTGFALQVNGNYLSQKIVTQGKQEKAWWLDVGVRKMLLKDKATLVLNVSDIFDTRKILWIYELPMLTQSIYLNRETRIARLTFTYSFGRSDMRNKVNSKRKAINTVLEKDRNNLKTDN